MSAHGYYWLNECGASLMTTTTFVEVKHAIDNVTFPFIDIAVLFASCPRIAVYSGS